MNVGIFSSSEYSSGSFTPSNTYTWSPFATSVWKYFDSVIGMRMHPCDAGCSGTFIAPWMAMP